MFFFFWEVATAMKAKKKSNVNTSKSSNYVKLVHATHVNQTMWLIAAYVHK